MSPFTSNRQVLLKFVSSAPWVWQNAADRKMRGKTAAIQRPFMVFLALLIALANTPFKAFSQSAGVSLSMPSQTVVFPNAFDTGKSFPTVSNGFLISFTREMASPGGILLTNIGTSKEVSPGFWLSEASKILLYDAAVTPDKQFLLLAGTYTPSAGGADVPFIATQNLASGKSSVVNPTGDYVPVRVCGTSDGTIWSLGQTQAEILHIEVTQQPEYAMVRNYSLNGSLRGSFVPRSSQGTLPINLLPLGRAFGNKIGTNITPAKLSCGDTSVGVFVGFPVHSWSEIDTRSKIVQQWQLKPLPHSTMTGLVLLGGNTVYASFATAAPQGRTLSLSRLTLSPDHSGEWTQVADNGAADKHFSVLLGRDGPALVYLRGKRGPTNTTLYWSTP